MWNNSFCNFGPIFGSGHWFIGSIVPLLFFGLIAWVTIGLLQKIFVSPKTRQKECALDILKRRYAAEEIDKKQFEEIEEWVKNEVKECVEFADASPYPEAKELYEDVYKEDNYPFIVEY